MLQTISSSEEAILLHSEVTEVEHAQAQATLHRASAVACCKQRDACLQTVPPTPSEIDEAPVSSVRQKTPPGYKVFASPATKHLAKENNINLAAVTGTGPEGRITRGQHSQLHCWRAWMLHVVQA